MTVRDYFFEFAGMPKSGKTTVFDSVVHYLKRKGFRIGEHHGGGRYAPIEKSSHASLNMYLAGKAVEFVLVNAEREKSQQKIFMMDRGVYDRCIFTAALNKLGEIDSAETEATTRYLTIPRVTRLIDGVFLFVSSPKLSIEREYKNRLIKKEGRVMNESFLEALQVASLEIYQKELSFKNVHLMNTEALDGRITECTETIVNSIIKIIGQENGTAL